SVSDHLPRHVLDRAIRIRMLRRIVAHDAPPQRLRHWRRLDEKARHVDGGTVRSASELIGRAFSARHPHERELMIACIIGPPKAAIHVTHRIPINLPYALEAEGQAETLLKALLWLFTINLGIVFGAGLYESRVVVPLWASAPPMSLRSPDTGRRFWAFVSTIPLTLLALANLAAAWGAAGPERAWWLSATLIVLVERAATFAFFIPTMLRLQR